MDLIELREQLEEDLSWRIDELRHLRNSLLGDLNQEDWPVSAMRTVLVMQYAHLEGFARNAFHLYVEVVNRSGMKAADLQPQLLAAALAEEFSRLRSGGSGEENTGSTKLSRRAKNQVSFIARLRESESGLLTINAGEAISMEMNFGEDVLRKTLYILAFPEDVVPRHQYRALEFVRRTRNDIAHGSRKENIPRGEFLAHREKCEQFMVDLVRLVTEAAANGWYMRSSVDGSRSG